MLDGCVARPQEEIDRYRAAGYWTGEPLGAALRRWAATHRDRTALVGEGRRISYAGLDSWADRLAAGLRGLGIGPGDRVVVQLPNAPDFVAVCFGLFRLGAVPVFSLPAHRSYEVRHLCELSGAVAHVVPGSQRGFDHVGMSVALRKEVPSLRHTLVVGEPRPGTPGDVVLLDGLTGHPGKAYAPDPTDAAFFLLSGGTTALPKLIPRTHDDYGYQIRATAEVCGLGPQTVYLAVLPVEFNFTWGCPGILGTLHAGGTVVFAPDPSPDTCFPLIAAERVTLTSVVPTIAHLWMGGNEHARHDLSSLALLQIGSAKLHRHVAEQVRPVLGCALQQVFGMAEGLLTMTRRDDPDDVVLATQGRPVSPADVIRVADPVTGERAEPGEVGELVTRGPYTLRGYYRAPEHNRTAFTDDGFFRSGDLVRLTARGDLVVEGRVKDVVIRGGDKVSATELEGHLTRHPRVAQAAVVAVPDPALGEAICACVMPDGDPPGMPELRCMLRESGVADFKLPDLLEIYDAFPLTGLGKVDKKALAADAAGRRAARGEENH
ncbi:(2,3-dihydroxybenzoyl)adenylate synthase [Streptomyces griseoviridis]|uniref:2,3-dihydroxybenzoate-AMP ligase/pristinamycin I synthetase-1 n=1 Tax=Streptomyces griseoviridis TaxID=45398 RepID=A0ABT9LN80_STRGD|nr:AMP-binding protein [Streptomyces griseoviridis]MDP9685001.1 2,3-dihydroxybenzoate-AMP ligase/pristinamycin I synthetase-1 [Streptomyces griseoviridis]GGT21502.1 2,3-dihydroxybenzoate-AMP ligase [Streptomyces griseoviridis]